MCFIMRDSEMRIRKILIANRGEIAVRLIRTFRRMGIQSVALAAPPDRMALHALLADEVAELEGETVGETYLHMEQILEIAKRHGVDAIHPGYGFLSENPAFARAVESAGLIFIGPRAETMEALGDKVKAKHLARSADVPVIPGSPEALYTLEEVQHWAEKTGYPLLLKASMGGGGKGMRLVERPEALPSAFRLAREEARNAFGDPGLYVEKYLKRPRHVEFQILADQHGNVLHLFERECSIQRRHQKLVEESPSPALTPGLREEMGEAARRLAKEVGYVNAGTVEFLLAEDGAFYFIEVNARLQVEHPVTEWITGLDLVEWQVRIAQGEALPFSQDALEPRGHAVEARIYAEDPFMGFLPSPGMIRFLREPSGPFVRVDSGIYAGYTVPSLYDPLLSKIIVWGQNREESLERLRIALEETWILGVETTLPFLLKLIQHPAFRRGDLSTRFLEEHPDLQEMHFSQDREDPLETVAFTLFTRPQSGAVSSSQTERPSGDAPSLWHWVARREATGQ